jgi:hypothetical protein
MRPPDFVIGTDESPYLLRWYLWPRSWGWRLYLHKFLRDDDDRALHDHPWWFWSFIVKGGYDEVVPHSSRPASLAPGVNWPLFAQVRRRRFSLAFRRAEHRHRVVLHRDAAGRPVPCWTLVLTGRRTRTWGFWCPRGFVPWQEFTAPGDSGKVGKGCGE